MTERPDVTIESSAEVLNQVENWTLQLFVRGQVEVNGRQAATSHSMKRNLSTRHDTPDDAHSTGGAGARLTIHFALVRAWFWCNLREK